MEFPNDQIDVLASLLELNLSDNYLEAFPDDLPFLYRLRTLLARYVFKWQ